MVNKVAHRWLEIKKKYLKSDIIKRSISSLVLALFFLIALYSGGLLYSTLVIIIGIMIAHEFFIIVYRAKSEIIKGKQKYKWYFLGAVYSLVTIAAMLFLRNQNEISNVFAHQMMLWVCIIVWCTDTAAYFVGIAVGGLKIMPKVSPSKTWSGLIGALFFSIIAHEIAVKTVVTDLFNPEISKMIIWSSVIFTSIISQMGDFLESAFKRRFHVKDSSNIIPGHGGVMDRMDGLSITCIVWFIIFNTYLLF